MLATRRTACVLDSGKLSSWAISMAMRKAARALRLPTRACSNQSVPASLVSAGVARFFDGSLDDWRYPPLAETARAAREVRQRMGIAS